MGQEFLTPTRCAITQETAVLIYFATEARNHVWHCKETEVSLFIVLYVCVLMKKFGPEREEFTEWRCNVFNGELLNFYFWWDIWHVRERRGMKGFRWRNLNETTNLEGFLTVHLPHGIMWNASLMQRGNFIGVYLARHVSGTYAHHQEH